MENQGGLSDLDKQMKELELLDQQIQHENYHYNSDNDDDELEDDKSSDEEDQENEEEDTYFQ